MSLSGTLDVTTDDVVTFVLTVENVGDEPVEIDFTSGKQADFAIRPIENGKEVWRWSEGRAFMQVLTALTLAPGESETYEVTWDNPEPGEYRAIASLEGDPGIETEETFSVRGQP